MTAADLKSLIALLPTRSVAVLGDYCVDYYLTIDPAGSEVSVETGLPTRAVREVRLSPGGAGNVVANLLAMGVGSVAAFGVVGSDLFGRELSSFLSSLGADTSGLLIQRGDWHTSVYTKLYEGEHEHERVDYGNFNLPTTESVSALLARLSERLADYNAIVVNQQVRSGIHSEPFRRGLSELIERERDRVFLVDSRSFSDEYPGAYRKLNSHEGARLCGLSSDPRARIDRQTAIDIAEGLYDRWRKPLFLSRGEEGCLVRDELGLHEIAGVAVSGPTDPVGAGDALLAGIAAALAAGAPPDAAAELGNLAAAVTVTKLFQTGTASPSEILALGNDPDYRFQPELAATIERATLLPGSEIEVVSSVRRGPLPRCVLFDNDGTLSTLRQGWELIMEPLMMEAALGGRAAECSPATRERIAAAVRELIERTTGAQTIIQMRELVELIRRFGVVEEQRILTPSGYKRLYNERLMRQVDRRLEKLASGALEPGDFLVKGARELLHRLASQGLKLYLASGTDQEDTVREAKALGYAELFGGRIYGSVGDVASDPKRQVVRKILEEVGGGADLLTFGDGPVEIRESRKAGGYAVGVASDEVRRWGLNPEKRSRLIRAGADLIVPDYTELTRLAEAVGLGR